MHKFTSEFNLKEFSTIIQKNINCRKRHTRVYEQINSDLGAIVGADSWAGWVCSWHRLPVLGTGFGCVCALVVFPKPAPSPSAGSDLLGCRHIPNLGTSNRAFPKHLPPMGCDSMFINLSNYSHLTLAGYCRQFTF